ncbi:MAG: hypothetical protein E6K80_05880 [Candidatus Eisenbacteria bacterium]|uniref:Uncharacterized protein n=1 Tax=Eiseniibacteriota bacterium TaxID=2212470 RepID=A0A538U615_UNCEI|nr:MAG: hypothetical protein E6K80_05880 [Candidatus Eisenbacteria bacterium]
MSPSRIRSSIFGAALLVALSSAAARDAWCAVSVTVSGQQTGVTAVPGVQNRVFVLSITNNDLATSGTLTSVTFTNLTTAPLSTQSQRDQDWQTLELWDQSQISQSSNAEIRARSRSRPSATAARASAR